MADSVVDAILLGELYLEVLGVTRGRKRARLERWFEAVAATVDGCTDDTPDGALIPQFGIHRVQFRGNYSTLFSEPGPNPGRS